MVELLRSNDVILIDAIAALLRSAGFVPFLFDQHVSVMEGSIGAIPRRLMIAADDAERARAFLREAGYAGELGDVAD